MDPQDHNPASAPKSATPSRDAVRSRAWRSRHGQYLQSLLKAAGVETQAGSTRSHMAQLKKVFAAVWTQAMHAAPASMIRHDPGLSRAERRRISSVKNNRLCRHRHHVFLQGVERELSARGLLPADVAELRARPSAAPQPRAEPSAPRLPHHAGLGDATGAVRPSPSPAPLPRTPFGIRRDDA